MMADEDFDFLEKVFNKLRSARNTKSSVRLNHAEIKIILKNQEDIMDMLRDMFDDFNHELVEIKKIIDEFEKGIGMKE